MYVFMQRDMELVCDESVVHCFGELSKSAYANMLIDMEKRKNNCYFNIDVCYFNHWRCGCDLCVGKENGTDKK